MSEVARILNDAADLLARTGLCKGAYHREHGRQERFCILGAIGHVCGATYTEDFTRGCDPVLDAVYERLGIPAFSIADWNDHPKRRRTEVVNVLRDAAREVMAHGA